MPVLDTIGNVTQQIRSYDRHIQQLCKEQYPETLHLQRISGVGPVTSLAFVLTIEDPNRFDKSREVGPALGLVGPNSGRSDGSRRPAGQATGFLPMAKMRSFAISKR